MNTEALKALLEQSESDEKACEQLGAMSFELAAEVIKLREQQRWIPVSERLPTEDAKYLCVHPFMDIVGRPILFTTFFRTGSSRFSEPVSHWMPLPEAPAGEQA